MKKKRRHQRLWPLCDLGKQTTPGHLRFPNVKDIATNDSSDELVEIQKVWEMREGFESCLWILMPACLCVSNRKRAHVNVVMMPEAAGINHWSSQLYVSRLIIHLPLSHYISLSNTHTGCLTKAWHEVGRTPIFTLTSHSIATNDPSAWRLPHQPLIHPYCPLITVEGFIMRHQVKAAPHSYKSSPHPDTMVLTFSDVSCN